MENKINQSGTYTFQHGQQFDQKLRTLKACKALLEEAGTMLINMTDRNGDINDILMGVSGLIHDTSLAITNEEDRLNERI